jgi:hypothetical protein
VVQLSDIARKSDEHNSHRVAILDSPRVVEAMPDPKYKPPYAFSVTIGETCNRKSRNFIDLAEKLKMDVTDLMRQCNGHASPSKALVKGLA